MPHYVTVPNQSEVRRGDYSFFDIGGIVDQHCLNFLFIITNNISKQY